MLNEPLTQDATVVPPVPVQDRPRAHVSLRSLQWETWALAALIVAAAAIRILVIDTQSLWTDEALTAAEARASFGTMMHMVLHIETTPPLYFLLEWGWAKVFGTSAAALRAISTLAGIGLVPIAYLAGRELASRRAGLLAAAIVCVNPFMIWYSQEARAYMLLAFLTGAGFVWFVRAAREPSRRNLGWWALFSSLAVLTHFFAGFAVAPEALWLLWVGWRRTLGAVAIVTVVQLALVPLATSDTGHGVGWIAQTPRLKRMSQTVSTWAVSNLFRRTSVAEGLIGGALLIAVVALLLFAASDRSARQKVAIAAWTGWLALLTPLALGLAGQDYFIPRNVIPAFLPLAVVIAAACAAPWDRKGGRRSGVLAGRAAGATLALSLLVGFSAASAYVQTHPFLERPQWQQLAQALGRTASPRAILAAGGTTADPLKIYLPRVPWGQSTAKSVLIGEIDVIGARKRFKLLVRPSARAGGPLTLRRGSPTPRRIAPAGTRLIEWRRVHEWVVARYVLDHPIRRTINGLRAAAWRFFRHPPQTLLVIVQHGVRRHDGSGR
jgi:mannosyltransferase